MHRRNRQGGQCPYRKGTRICLLGYDCGKRESVRNRRRERTLQSGRHSRQGLQERHKAQDTGLLLCADRVAVCRSREDVQERGRRDGAYEIPPLVSSRQEDQQDRGAPWVLCRLGTKKEGRLKNCSSKNPGGRNSLYALL